LLENGASSGPQTTTRRSTYILLLNCEFEPFIAIQSLADAQKVLDKFLPTVKAVDGVKGVQRVVCGGCLDFKVIVSLPADKFGPWAEKKFEPEESFLNAVKNIPGVSVVETQTYTLMPM
jgi:hypothetical protein